MTVQITDLLGTYGSEWHLLSAGVVPADVGAAARLLRAPALLRARSAGGLRQIAPHTLVNLVTHALGPRVVPAVPGVPPAPRAADRQGARDDGRGRAVRVHARRPAADGRRLRRDPARRTNGSARWSRRPLASAVAGADGRVPGLRARRSGGTSSAGSRARRARRGDARRLPAGHVRPHRPDAADPARVRDRQRRRLARRAGVVDGHRFEWRGIDGSTVAAEYLPEGRQRRAPPARARQRARRSGRDRGDAARGSGTTRCWPCTARTTRSRCRS